jgi:hypothetical protein
MIWPLSNRPWLAPAPIVGQYALMNDILAGKPPGAFFIVVAAVCTAIVAGILVAITARLLERERIVFGR